MRLIFALSFFVFLGLSVLHGAIAASHRGPPCPTPMHLLRVSLTGQSLA
jgi:hypothetical protein